MFHVKHFLDLKFGIRNSEFGIVDDCLRNLRLIEIGCGVKLELARKFSV